MITLGVHQPSNVRLKDQKTPATLPTTGRSIVDTFLILLLLRHVQLFIVSLKTAAIDHTTFCILIDINPATVFTYNTIAITNDS